MANHAVANAVGAAIAQVSGEVDQIFTNLGREELLEQARKIAVGRAVAAGADADTVTVIEQEDIPAGLPAGQRRPGAGAGGGRDRRPRRLNRAGSGIGRLQCRGCCRTAFGFQAGGARAPPVFLSVRAGLRDAESWREWARWRLQPPALPPRSSRAACRQSMKHWAAGVGGESARVTMHTRAAGSAVQRHHAQGARQQLMLEQVAHEDAQRVAFGDQGQAYGDGLAGDHIAGRRQAVGGIGQAQQVGRRLDIARHQPERLVQLGQAARAAQRMADARAYRQRQVVERGAGEPSSIWPPYSVWTSRS